MTPTQERRPDVTQETSGDAMTEQASGAAMTEQEAHDVLRARGRVELREVLGESFADKRDATTNDFNAPLRRLTEEFGYGSLWTRPGLDRKQRSMIMLAMICAMNRPFELRVHLVAALRNGCTVEEIREIFIQSSTVSGFPAAIDSLREAEVVLKELGKL
jgi:4-carboxymuconolactone decarboxylase